MKAEKIDKVMMFEKLDKYLNDGRPIPSFKIILDFESLEVWKWWFRHKFPICFVGLPNPEKMKIIYLSPRKTNPHEGNRKAGQQGREY
jgi:hypothetical protein